MNCIEQAIDSVITQVATDSYNIAFNSQQKQIDELKSNLIQKESLLLSIAYLLQNLDVIKQDHIERSNQINRSKCICDVCSYIEKMQLILNQVTDLKMPFLTVDVSKHKEAWIKDIKEIISSDGNPTNKVDDPVDAISLAFLYKKF